MPRDGWQDGSWTVDLRLLFELLSDHLYPSRMAFLRELVTNAVDAIGLRPTAGGVVDIRVEPGRIRVSDDGRGLALSDVGTCLGRIADSGTQRLHSLLGGGPAELPPPIGLFGVGLLACRTVARTIRIDSWREGEPDGVSFEWDGGANYRWKAVTRPDRAGTTVTLVLRAPIKPQTVQDYLEEHVPYVDATILLDGNVVGDRDVPWRSGRQAPACGDGLEWGRRRKVEGAGNAVVVPRGADGPGGTVVFWPDEDTSWHERVDVFRSGVRVLDVRPSPLPAALSWLRVVTDLPDIGITLDRHSLTPEGAALLADRLTRSVAAGFLALLREECRRPASRRWWERHREHVIDALEWGLQTARPSLAASDRTRLASWLPFHAQAGLRTLAELLRPGIRRLVWTWERDSDARWSSPAPPDTVALRLKGEAELAVLRFLAAEAGPTLEQWTRGGRSRPPDQGPVVASVERLARLLSNALEPFSVAVRLDSDFLTRAQVARWQSPPPWLPQSRREWNPDAVVGTASGGGTPVLGLNPWSPVVQVLAAGSEPEMARAVGWLLAEWASAIHIHPHEPQGQARGDRLVDAACRVVRARVPAPGPDDRPVCFVAYDWTGHRDEFQAIRTLFSLPPFGWRVIDAATELHGEYIRDNILDCMERADVFVSLLAPPGAPGKCATCPNPNVLLEAGVAASYRPRPHLVCLRRGQRPISDLDGLLYVAYDSLEDLAAELDKVTRARGLHTLGRDPTSPPQAPAQ